MVKRGEYGKMLICAVIRWKTHPFSPVWLCAGNHSLMFVKYDNLARQIYILQTASHGEITQASSSQKRAQPVPVMMGNLWAFKEIVPMPSLINTLHRGAGWDFAGLFSFFLSVLRHLIFFCNQLPRAACHCRLLGGESWNCGLCLSICCTAVSSFYREICYLTAVHFIKSSITTALNGGEILGFLSGTHHQA